MLRFTSLSLFIGAALAVSVMHAADLNAPVALSGVQVTAADAPLQWNVPGTDTVINRQQMDRHLVGNIRQLVQYEPGVSAIGTAGRFGLDSFNVRGLSGNRTRIEIDGVSLPASFGAALSGGSFRAGRNFVDLDEIKRVEIIRGPASAVYPSDALGGVVSFTTKDPADVLSPGKKVYTAVKERYDSADRSFTTTATLAGGDARNGVLWVMNHRQGHETQNMGEVGGSGNARTRPDPLSYKQDTFLGKYVHTAASGRVDRYIVDGSRTRTRTDGLSQLVPAYGVTPTYYHSNDEDTRVRASAGQSFTPLGSMLADTLDWNLYWQQSLTRTRTQTDYSVFDRYFDSLPIKETVAGGKLVVFKHAGEHHSISYGVEISRTQAQSSADGYGIDTQTGAISRSKPAMPNDYPLHLIPESFTYRYALFGQDEIGLLGDRLAITPGLRADRYEYQPGNDPLYLKYNPGYVQSNYSQNHLSPKLGVIWRINDMLSTYANAAYGFRPPLYSEIGGAWNEQPVAGINIAFLPNPALKAETSRGVEIGLRGHGQAGWFNVAGYFNAYRNFIWSGYALPASEVPAWAYQIAPGVSSNQFFQATNARKAYIKGVEANGALHWDVFSEALRGWSLKGSAAITTGRLIQPGTSAYAPLNTVDPAKLILGISYDAPHWGTEFIVTAVRRHTRLSDSSIFRPGGYATLDYYAYYSPVQALELYAGISNLANRKYWDWGNLNSGALSNLISGNGLNDAGTGSLPADRFSMPGRTFSLAARIAF